MAASPRAGPPAVAAAAAGWSARAGAAAARAARSAALAARALAATWSSRARRAVDRDVEAQLVAAVLAALPLVGDVAVVPGGAPDDQVLAGRRLDRERGLERGGEALVVLAGRLDADGDQVPAG